MMLVALLLRPSLILCAIPGKLLPRILADDIILAAIGDLSLADFVCKFNVLV